MMEHAVPHENLNTGPWPECVETANKLGNIIVNQNKDKCAHERFYGKMLDYSKYLRTLG